MTNAKILVAEDEQSITQIFKMSLPGFGYVITRTVSTGEEAVRAVEECKPDLVLMDIGLEGKMDGVEAARRIHCNFEVPIIFVTGNSDDATLERAKLAEPVGYILKPFETQNLRATIETALHRYQAIRRRTEDVLQQQEQRYRALFENAVIGIFRATQSGRLIEANAALASILGYDSPEELIVAVTDPEKQLYVQPNRRRELLDATDRCGFVKDFEYEAYRKDGTKIWLSQNTRVLRDSKGGALCLEGTIQDITDRKRAENALSAVLARQGALIAAVPDIIMEVDQNKVYTWSNQAGFEFFGEDVIGKEAACYFDGEQDTYRAVQPLFDDDEKMVHVESWQRRRDGQKRLLAWRCQVLRDGSGHVTGALSSGRDITEIRLAELARSRSLARQVRLNQLQQALLGSDKLMKKLKMITDSIVDIFGVDFCRIWCIGPGDLCELGCMHAAISDGPHVCKHRDKCLRLMASSGRYTHTNGAAHRRVPFGAYKIGLVASGAEHRFLTNDVAGDPRIHNHDWAKELGLVSFAGYQLRPPGGDTLGVLALFSIHALTPEEDAQLDALSNTVAQVIRTAQADEALQQAGTYNRSLIEASLDPLVTIGPEGKITDVNVATEEVTGLSRDALVGTDFCDYFTEQEKARAVYQQVFQEGYVRDYPLEIRHREGRTTPVVYHAAAYRDNAGKVGGVFAAARDITQQKRAADERASMEIKLRQAQKLEAIGQLAAGIAHEINTPTQYVGDNTRFLQDSFVALGKALKTYNRLFQASRDGNIDASLITEVETTIAEVDLEYLNEEIPKALSQSLEGVSRVASIVRAMKEFSHPGGEEKQAIDLNHAIENTLMVCRNEWKYVAEMVTDLAPDLPLVPCLPGEFNQVVLNLVVNAAHAVADAVNGTEKSKGTITVCTRPISDWVEIQISDTGTGIPEQLRSKIFTPFFTTKQVGKGTGQGLAICHSVVVGKHGGTIDFETEVGKGTTFIIRLPLESRNQEKGQ